MSYDESDAYDESSYSEDDNFDAWEVAHDTQSANAAIANRIKVMQKLFKETMAIAKAFDVSVSFELDSDDCGGHNRPAYINWNPSSQNC
jgi:hypothetical protein